MGKIFDMGRGIAKQQREMKEAMRNIIMPSVKICPCLFSPDFPRPACKGEKK
jgi:hypothetical protein